MAFRRAEEVLRGVGFRLVFLTVPWDVRQIRSSDDGESWGRGVSVAGEHARQRIMCEYFEMSRLRTFRVDTASCGRSDTLMAVLRWLGEG